MTRTVLYSKRPTGTPIGAFKPDAANIVWQGDGLSRFRALEFWISPETGGVTSGFPVTLNLQNGRLHGDITVGDPVQAPVALLPFIGLGNLMVERVSENSLKVWFDRVRSSQKPTMVERIVGIGRKPRNVGGALDFQNTNTFHEYALTERLDPDSVYQFRLRNVRTGGNSDTLSIPFIGNDVLELVVQADTNFDAANEGNIMNVGYGRAESNGAKRLAIGLKDRDGAAVDTLYLATHDTDDDIHSLRKLVS